jgi:deazaflavin-dependent oxidoreductase (nitroreductase family)
VKVGPLWALATVGLLVAPLLAAMIDDLQASENAWSVKLTTIGRLSGQPRTVTIWFVHEGGRVYVQAGKDGHTDWYRNLLKNPDVGLDFGKLVLRGRAQPSGADEEERIHALFRQKYLTARISGWFGGRFGSGKAVVIDSLESAPRQAVPSAGERSGG